jgi:hypothetical protein
MPVKITAKQRRCTRKNGIDWTQLTRSSSCRRRELIEDELIADELLEDELIEDELMEDELVRVGIGVSLPTGR